MDGWCGGPFRVRCGCPARHLGEVARHTRRLADDGGKLASAAQQQDRRAGEEVIEAASRGHERDVGVGGKRPGQRPRQAGHVAGENSAAPGGERVLAAVRALPELARRRVTQKPLTGEEIDAELVTPTWKRAVYANTGLPAGAVDRDAYVVCVLEALHRALGQRDVYARPSHRWAGPRALLLEGDRWAAVREDVLAGLSLTDPAPTHLARQLITLDAAWKQTAARLGEAGDDARARVVARPERPRPAGRRPP